MTPTPTNLLNALSLSPTESSPISSLNIGSSSRMNSNNPPRFYLPSATNSPVYPLSRVHSRAQSDTNASAESSSSSKDALYAGRSRSKASISNLRSALELYQIDHHHSEVGVNDLTSPDPNIKAAHNVAGTSTDIQHQEGTVPDDRSSLCPPSPSSSLANSKMDALVEIHRVLYRGKEDLQVKRIELTLKEEVRQVRRVVERWFESDCVYDQPLVHLTSRESLLMHFALLHVFGTVYLPSIRPSAIMFHLKEANSSIRETLLDNSDDPHSDLHISTKEGKSKMSNTVSLPKSPGEEERLLGLGLGMGADNHQPKKTHLDSATKDRMSNDGSKNYEGWWKLWDVTADCKEIGEMECYDGHYLAMIEHVVRLSLFPTYRTPTKTTPSTSHPSAYFHPKTPNPHFKHHPQNQNRSKKSQSPILGIGIPAIPVPSFAKRIFRCMKEDFVDCWLDWELRVNTMIQFNEVGKATHVRDVIDIRDLVESFVPLAKRLHLITTITGMITSTIGAIILFLLDSNHKHVNVISEGRMMGVDDTVRAHEKGRRRSSTAGKVASEKTMSMGHRGSASEEKPSLNNTKSSSSAPMRVKSPMIGVDPQMRFRKMSAPTPLTSTHNTLGLENVSPPTPTSASSKEGSEP
ncbi:hypothetical protein I302_104679 [Kwoniella bestiolae CBS 10118]|uniref:Uncharacterized protein n=1 Tax=Kwoniella bestiolae CBS 10118 TaxID=1296100 RepID=A0A1B9FS17_9TREE|nr:hypothetical protein I302_09252 [Kwoniella bestiolae CBS 10118]OCF21573.1 hypothetical protein I302_09252 [Kwoniella bestiolae CBS 10118]